MVKVKVKSKVKVKVKTKVKVKVKINGNREVKTYKQLDSQHHLCEVCSILFLLFNKIT